MGDIPSEFANIKKLSSLLYNVVDGRTSEPVPTVKTLVRRGYRKWLELPGCQTGAVAEAAGVRGRSPCAVLSWRSRISDIVHRRRRRRVAWSRRM